MGALPTAPPWLRADKWLIYAEEQGKDSLWDVGFGLPRPPQRIQVPLIFCHSRYRTYTPIRRPFRSRSCRSAHCRSLLKTGGTLTWEQLATLADFTDVTPRFLTEPKPIIHPNATSLRFHLAELDPPLPVLRCEPAHSGPS